MFILNEDRTKILEIGKVEIVEVYTDEMQKEITDIKNNILKHTYSYGNTEKARISAEQAAEKYIKNNPNQIKYAIYINGIYFAEYDNAIDATNVMESIFHAIEINKPVFRLGGDNNVTD